MMRSSSVRAGLAQRARIVLLAADGMSNTAIAQRVGVSRPTVIGWRGRYAQRGITGLSDEPRSGRPRTVDHRAVVAATLRPPPKKLGVTHWSSRLLADRLGIGNATVARAWRDYGIQPWRAETFKFSTDPELVAKVTDVVGLYLAPPEHAIVLCVDENSQIQALDRTQPTQPTQPGRPERRTHDYLRPILAAQWLARRRSAPEVFTPRRMSTHRTTRYPANEAVRSCGDERPRQRKTGLSTATTPPEPASRFEVQKRRMRNDAAALAPDMNSGHVECHAISPARSGLA